MKKIDFNSKEKYIAEEEGPIRRKKINWDRMVYLAILFFIIGSLIFYMIKNYYFISAPGQVVKESYVVLFPYDIRIDSLLVKEDQKVKAGEVLLNYQRDFRLEDNTLVNSTRTVDEWIIKERFTANRNISTKAVEIAEHKKQIQNLQEKIEKLKLLVILDASGTNNLENYEAEIERRSSQIIILEEEIRYWRGYLNELPRYRQQYQETLISQLDATGAVAPFRAPITGLIANINYKNYDLVYKGETILSIELDESYIRAYIPQKEYGSIFEGDVVTVIFPDRTKGKGVIEKIYSSLERLPPEYQDDTRTSVRSLLAVVRPLNKEQEKKWKLNDKLNVEIRKRRFF